ncbi:hypothetical protein BDW42DRAFT_192089 [Aspergillus terreus]|uniref:Uncharacterized protein n=1 Tax=Aspergillus terreus TaxID=33178 RepID=A0A5M3ZA16_ASPTE|nr:hypothetical protein ATETN484_0012041800 [Aspergillus terreus]GFF19656.1 hypothetical protein BDW42DRAFT_192089 [Aspergillus terreus]
MRLAWIATVATLFGLAVATCDASSGSGSSASTGSSTPSPIENGATCKLDGSLGWCKSGYCFVIQGQTEGKCQEKK